MSNTFREAYEKLNIEQKKAVDAIEGPVMVVAGPGTGKTQILTLRIANILQQTHARPSHILALTFTDSAAATMRRRLAAIIGEGAAREVMITTFHGFCEYVINAYGEYFSAFAKRRPLGDVEQILLWQDVIDGAANDVLRPAKSPYTYLSDLKRLYDTLSREGMTPAEYREWGASQIAAVAADPHYQYVRGEKKGELKKTGLDKIARLEKIAEAATLLEAYDLEKEKQLVYDFSDMLRVAIDTIAREEELRSELMETYQYILADEHQDANALQHKLLELMAFDESPNLFVVGDEKQAVYRFQGASSEQFQHFTTLFPRAQVIALQSSFRSLQNVLDVAHEAISKSGEHPQLAAVREGGAACVSRISAVDPLAEQQKIATLVAASIAKGTKPHEIAVITRKNDTADIFARHLEAHGVPVLRAGDVSLTSRPIIRYILALMTAVADPLDIGSLRFALLAPWWQIDTTVRARLLRQHSDKTLRKALEETAPEIMAALQSIEEKAKTGTPIETFSYLLEISGARSYILSRAELFDDIPLIRLLMMHFEEIGNGGTIGTFAEVVAKIVRAHKESISVVKRSETKREGMVSVITAHKAKGMEFEEVYIPDLVESSWEKGGKPALITSPFDAKQSFDDALRLFYVALTRAKDRAFLSCAFENKDGRERRISTLVPDGLSETDVDVSALPRIDSDVEAGEVVRLLTKQYLTEDGLSPSALNEYMKSPAEFFARRVLRIHEPPQGPETLGSAVHRGISVLLKGGTIDRAHQELEHILERSLLPRNRVFEDLSRTAHASLDAYAASDLSLGVPKYMEELFVTHRTIAGESIAIQGKIDAVFETPKGLCIADFKTGSSVSAKDENHARQLLLYTTLMHALGHESTEAVLVQVTPEKVKSIPVVVTDEAREAALRELDCAVEEMLSGRWRSGEPSQYDALLQLS